MSNQDNFYWDHSQYYASNIVELEQIKCGQGRLGVNIDDYMLMLIAMAIKQVK